MGIFQHQSTQRSLVSNSKLFSKHLKLHVHALKTHDFSRVLVQLKSRIVHAYWLLLSTNELQDQYELSCMAGSGELGRQDRKAEIRMC